jgi:Ala-tRNA(Pro) deacylase
MFDSRGIAYQERHHAPAYTGSELAEHEHMSGHRVAKVVVAMADGRPVELVLPATRHVVLEKVAEALGARDVRLASEDEVARYFKDCEIGAVPPLRHWKDIDVVMDEAMRVDGDMMFQAGTHDDAIVVKFEDWRRVVNPRAASFSIPAPSGQRADNVESPYADDPDLCASPEGLRRFLSSLLDILHLQAKEIERLTSHVEQQTDSTLTPTEMPLVVSELSGLQAVLGREAATAESAAPK